MLFARSAAALTLGCLFASAAAGAAEANRNPASEVYRAAQAISYELGSKRAVGYFLTRDGMCQLTLMIAEATDPDLAPPPSAARLSVAIQPGQSAALASAEGGSMLLTCGSGAETMLVKYGVSVRS
jgi:hypothetical protein